ncbi:MAG TPA: extracellular solute-binding protein, partial [Thermomicrobiales bacterium]|nr:extracellular solute-binding protein [Thermomicrobiales bacterium]
MFENELKRQRKAAAELVDQHLGGSLNRRSFLGKAAALGISVPVLTQVLGARGAFAQSASPSPVAEENVTLGSYDGKKLKISIALAESEAQVFKDVVVAGFKDKTGGDIDLVNIEATDVIRTLQAQKQSGNVQLDLLVQDNNSLAQLVSGGLVEEITNAEQVMPAATIPSLKDVLQFDGKYYFLPARPNVQIAYYNSKSFDGWGLKPPTTWDDLKSVGDEVKKQSGIGKLSIQGVPGGAAGVTVTQFIWQAGGDPLKINTDQGKTAFEFMQNLKPDLTPQYPTATFDTTNNYLLNESVVLAQNWPFGINVIVDQGGKKEVLAYSGWAGPTGKNVLVLGGDVFGIVAGTQL